MAMIMSKPPRQRTPILQKLRFRRRETHQTDDDDDDLLSLQSLDMNDQLEGSDHSLSFSVNAQDVKNALRRKLRSPNQKKSSYNNNSCNSSNSSTGSYCSTPKQQRTTSLLDRSSSFARRKDKNHPHGVITISPSTKSKSSSATTPKRHAHVEQSFVTPRSAILQNRQRTRKVNNESGQGTPRSTTAAPGGSTPSSSHHAGSTTTTTTPTPSKHPRRASTGADEAADASNSNSTPQKNYRRKNATSGTPSSSRSTTKTPSSSSSNKNKSPTRTRTTNTNGTTSSTTNEYDKIVHAAQALDATANELFAKGDLEQALTTYTRALRLKRRTLRLGVDPETDQASQLLASVATSMNNIGYLRQRAGGSTEEIMAAYQDSLQIKKEILGEADLSVGKTLNNIGSVYFGTRAYPEAMDAYVQARTIMSLCLGEKHLDVATVNSNIGDVLLAQKKLELARNSYKQALNIRWTQLGEHNPKVVRLLEKIAAIEMADRPEKQDTVRVEGGATEPEEDEEYAPEKQMKELARSVKEDVVYVDLIKRQLALEMIRDKIQLLRDLKHMEQALKEEALEETAQQEHDVAPLTPEQRQEALSAIKERVSTIKSRRARKREPSFSSSFANLDAQFEATLSLDLDFDLEDDDMTVETV